MNRNTTKERMTLRPSRLDLFISTILVSALLAAVMASSAFALPEKFFGMTAQEHAYDQGSSSSEPNWAAMQNAGVQRFRMEIKWSKVVAAGNWKEEAAWQNTYDRYFEGAAKHGIAILPYLYGRKTENTQYFLLSETSNYAEWLQFVWTVVQRYGQAGTFWSAHQALAQYPVTTWEVWNEPNLNVNSPGGTGINGKTYGQFLVGTSKTIHEAQEKLGYTPQVLFGGLYEERWHYLEAETGGYMGIYKYLAQASEASGIASSYNALSVHPYALGGAKDTHNFSEKAAGVPTDIYDAWDAQKSRIGSKPIWVTEMGWPVSGGDAERVSNAEQGGLLTESFNWIKANYSTYNIQYAAWFDYQDYTSDPTTPWDQHCGLRSELGWYRPAWYAYEEETGATKWPAISWHGENLTGEIRSDPVLASESQGQMELVAKGTDNALYYRSWNLSSGWGGWGAVAGGTGAVSSGPGAVSWGPNRLDIVARAVDGSVNHWWWDGSAWHSENIAGSIVGDPAIASEGPGQLELVATGTDNNLYYRSWTAASGWGGWGAVAGGTGAVSSGPGAVSWGPNRLDIVARAVDGSVNHWWWDGSAWHSENLAGSITSDPTLASEGPGQLELLAKGSDNAIYYRSWNLVAGWGGWGAVAGGTGTATSGPGAVSWGPNRLDIVAEASNTTPNHWWWGY